MNVVRGTYKRHLPLRSKEKPKVWEIKPGQKIYSFNLITGQVTLVLKPRERFFDSNTIFKAPNHIYGRGYNHVDAEKRFKEFIQSIKNKQQNEKATEVKSSKELSQ